MSKNTSGMFTRENEVKSAKDIGIEDETKGFEDEYIRNPVTVYAILVRPLLLASAITALLFLLLCWNSFFITSSHTFSIDQENGVFLKDGEPFRYISGSLHYFRIPRIYWEDRLLKAKSAGLDAIQIYIPWNFHEPKPGEYLFDNERDVVEFINLAQRIGLLVLVRAGPYICAEWDFGGLPPWLLSSNPKLELRSSDPEYLKPVIRWFGQLLPKLKPLIYQNGGPIIMIQLENEYGSYFTCDQEYLSALYEYARFILGDEIILYTTDGNNMIELRCGSSDRRLFATVDFGVDEAKHPNDSFKALQQFQPHGPLVNSEYYSGWLDHWGEKRHVVDANAVAEGALNLWNMSQGVSFNIYMFHGGTNFGLWSGANSPTEFIITSYDYDAPISEAGDITAKYLILRDLFYRLKQQVPPPIPVNISKAHYGVIGLNFFSHLLYDLQGGVASFKPLYMEALEQYQGLMAYTAILEHDEGKANLTFEGVKDTGLVFTTDFRAGSIIFHGSVSGCGSLNITVDKEHPFLIIVTECRGHVNFGPLMFGDIKGIVGRVLLDGKELLNWVMKALDFRTVNPPDPIRTNTEGTAFPAPGAIYKGVFHVPFPPMDTFAVVTGFTRGVLAVNGHIVGRFYPSAGPQVSLYVPSSMLICGENVVSILEFEKIQSTCLKNASFCSVTFRDSPVWLN
uniref:Beta-galactosidase n=1 Tax=Echinococcus granulosus TaxID=6210 RepID=A0A068WBF1_ECHGR|nr:beta galactosidase [Echinococcus granulosus]